MKPFRIITDWRAPYFGLAPGAPRRNVPSDLVLALREEEARRQRREEADRRAVDEHVRRLREQADVDQWRPLVEQFGSAAVETLSRRVDQSFELPVCLRGVAPAGDTQEET